MNRSSVGKTTGAHGRCHENFKWFQTDNKPLVTISVISCYQYLCGFSFAQCFPSLLNSSGQYVLQTQYRNICSTYWYILYQKFHVIKSITRVLTCTSRTHTWVVATPQHWWRRSDPGSPSSAENLKHTTYTYITKYERWQCNTVRNNDHWRLFVNIDSHDVVVSYSKLMFQ